MNHKLLVAALTFLFLFSLPAYAEQTFKSQQGFKIDYPSGWHMRSYMEIYKTLSEAQRAGGNFFRITSYPEDDARIDSPNIYSREQLRVEGWIFPGYNGTLAELITGTGGITKLEDFKVGGKKAKKVWRLAEDTSALGDDQVLWVYFVDDGKKVIFTCYPSYSSLLKECDRIVGSFRFVKY